MLKLSHQKRVSVLRRNFQVYSGMMFFEYCPYLPIYLLNSLTNFGSSHEKFDVWSRP